ncbi:accessory Sec system protein Asp1 [Lactococcus lactis]|uniref:accessory Sec system protein Asp1 n=1 Tax=Lactococcus lactis TaxID=1358 RepID=UPI00288CB5FE|nr:accessory Sec system protein Asp1 [Lactococcus lactis]MDT2887980.1 accessory Sec system protein Asp1 [Lactococcus lactis]MDT2930760.1 accessory Sec system protein Asp1 [Lactococcus lactis]
MIYFVPDWDKDMSAGLSTDDLIGKIQAFISSDTEYRVIIKDYKPALRYFLHRYDLFEANYISIFDELQGNINQNQRNLALNDLNFQGPVTFSFTPFNILVYRNEELVGSVDLGDSSYISKVSHISHGETYMVENYDDRGFISNRDKYINGEFYYKEFLDVQGLWIFRCFKNKNCKVNKSNSRGLKQIFYESIEEIKNERLEMYYELLKYEDSIVVSISDKNLPYIQKSKFLKQMALSFFKNRITNNQKNKEYMTEIVLRSRAIIVDSKQNLLGFNGYDEKKKIHIMSPYDSRFELSRSHELKEELIYIDSRGMKSEDIIKSLDTLLSYVKTEISSIGSERVFKFIIRVASKNLISSFSNIVRNFLFEMFPEEVLIVEGIMPQLSGENSIDATLLEILNPKTQKVMQMMKSFEFHVINNDYELFKIINKTRLIIDLGRAPDLFTQILGISAGIPQINSTNTEYVQANKNGLIIRRTEELYQSLQYYLDSLKHWQEARMNSVQKIKKYSGPALRKKVNQILGEVNE